MRLNVFQMLLQKTASGWDCQSCSVSWLCSAVQSNWKVRKEEAAVFIVNIPAQQATEQLEERTSQIQNHRNHTFYNVVAIDNDEVLLQMLKEMYNREGIHCDTCTDVAKLMELIRKKEYSLLLTI